MEPLNIAGNCGTDKHQKEEGRIQKEKRERKHGPSREEVRESAESVRQLRRHEPRTSRRNKEGRAGGGRGREKGTGERGGGKQVDHNDHNSTWTTFSEQE